MGGAGPRPSEQLFRPSWPKTTARVPPDPGRETLRGDRRTGPVATSPSRSYRTQSISVVAGTLSKGSATSQNQRAGKRDSFRKAACVLGTRGTEQNRSEFCMHAHGAFPCTCGRSADGNASERVRRLTRFRRRSSLRPRTFWRPSRRTECAGRSKERSTQKQRRNRDRTVSAASVAAQRSGDGDMPSVAVARPLHDPTDGGVVGRRIAGRTFSCCESEIASWKRFGRLCRRFYTRGLIFVCLRRP